MVVDDAIINNDEEKVILQIFLSNGFSEEFEVKWKRNHALVFIRRKLGIVLLKLR